MNFIDTRPRASVIHDGFTGTLWVDRFTTAISHFCNGRPPVEYIRGWFKDTDDDRLQQWVLNTLMPSGAWAQAIEIINAAERLADNPAEGCDHQLRPPEYTL